MLPLRRYSIIFLLSLVWCGLAVFSASAVDDTEVAALSALCRSYTGSLTDYANGVQAAYEAAAARRVKIVGQVFAVFEGPVDESKLLTAVTSWKVCVNPEPQPSTTPSDGFSIETIPARRVASTSCKDVPDAKACHGLIAQYLNEKKLGILGTYINGKDADGSLTMRVPVGPLPQP
jgi:hypothetical protein